MGSLKKERMIDWEEKLEVGNRKLSSKLVEILTFMFFSKGRQQVLNVCRGMIQSNANGISLSFFDFLELKRKVVC